MGTHGARESFPTYAQQFQTPATAPPFMSTVGDHFIVVCFVFNWYLILRLSKHTVYDGLGKRKVSRMTAKFWPEHLGELSCLFRQRILMLRVGLEIS